MLRARVPNMEVVVYTFNNENFVFTYLIRLNCSLWKKQKTNMQRKVFCIILGFVFIPRERERDKKAFEIAKWCRICLSSEALISTHLKVNGPFIFGTSVVNSS
jgi:hypothetical protein